MRIGVSLDCAKAGARPAAIKKGAAPATKVLRVWLIVLSCPLAKSACGGAIPRGANQWLATAGLAAPKRPMVRNFAFCARAHAVAKRPPRRRAASCRAFARIASNTSLADVRLLEFARMRRRPAK